MRALFRSLLLAAPLLTACGFDFESKGILLDRRILAIQADPPEVILGVSDLQHPVKFTALVADPKSPTEPINFEWRWCAPTFGERGNYNVVDSRCMETDSTPSTKGAATLNSLAYDLQPQEVVDVLQSSLGDQAALLLGAIGGGGSVSPKTPAFTGLLMAQLKLDDDSAKPLYGVKRIALSTLGSVSRQPNRNPQLASLLFDGQPWDPDVPIAVKVGDCKADKKVEVVDVEGPKSVTGQRPLVTVCEHRITPVFDDTQAEDYEAQTFDRDADGNFITEKAKERLRFDWTITDNGTLSSNTTEQPSSIGPQEYDPLSVHWREPPRLKGDSLRLWVVVRDGRGGESWMLRHITLSQ